MIKNFESTSIEIERTLNRLLSVLQETKLELVVHPQMDDYLSKKDKSIYETLVKKLKGQLAFRKNDELHLNGFEFYSLADGQKIEC